MRLISKARLRADNSKFRRIGNYLLSSQAIPGIYCAQTPVFSFRANDSPSWGLQKSTMENIFRKIAQDNTKFDAGDEEVR